MTVEHRYYGKEVAQSIYARLDRSLQMLGMEAEAAIVRDMGTMKSGTPPPKKKRKRRTLARSPGGKRRYAVHKTNRSRPGEAPAVQSKTLVDSVTSVKLGPLQVAVGTNIPYGRYHERPSNPARKRPWLEKNVKKVALRAMARGESFWG